MFSEEYWSLSSSLCSFLHFLVTSSLLGTNILPSTLFLNILSLHSSLNMSDQVLHPYTTTGKIINFDVLLTVHLSIFILVICQLDAQNFCFTISLFHASTCFEHHVLIARRSKTVLYSIWYLHTETSEWSKITKITKITKIYKYEHIVVKFMCEFFGCDYCVLLTINMLWHVEVMFIQLLNLLERYINVNRHSTFVISLITG